MAQAALPDLFSSADLLLLQKSGISIEDATLQIKHLREGIAAPKLTRPCTLADGIDRITDQIAELEHQFLRACKEGQLVHFIPASGAATRMGLADLPKALVPFHRYGSRTLTPVEEHIREASALAGHGVEVRLHFTIAPEHEVRFMRHVDETLQLLRGEGIRAEVTHSLQSPSTQTLALDENGFPFRDSSGNLLLRPGGHGALLPNLEACGAEFAWVHNVDNIAIESHRTKGRSLHRALAGKLIQIASKSDMINRPQRVCGMVANTGEPGGGPFWVSTSQGEMIEIVESAEVNASDEKQKAIFKSGTHFNPVDMICALRDHSGNPYRLQEFSNLDACFVASKTYEGRPLRALEWPGLWNGGMAYWDTVCVEIPLSLFTPVKTMEDLSRPEHQSEI